jgi:hypothetical protein
MTDEKTSSSVLPTTVSLSEYLDMRDLIKAQAEEIKSLKLKIESYEKKKEPMHITQETLDRMKS